MVNQRANAAREAYRKRDWATARDGFLTIRAGEPLVAADLDALADSAWWLGLADEAATAGAEVLRGSGARPVDQALSAPRRRNPLSRRWWRGCWRCSGPNWTGTAPPTTSSGSCAPHAGTLRG
jgi:hypothetical protein